MRQAKEEEQADIEEFDEDTTDKGEDSVRYCIKTLPCNFVYWVLLSFCTFKLVMLRGVNCTLF